MDAATVTDLASPAAGKAPVGGKSALARRDYLVGIGLLLIVVFLWTASNFVTQVSILADLSRCLLSWQFARI